MISEEVRYKFFTGFVTLSPLWDTMNYNVIAAASILQIFNLACKAIDVSIVAVASIVDGSHQIPVFLVSKF